jgi:hypothetical protein
MSAETVGKEGQRPGTARAERAPVVLRVLGMAAVCAGLAALAGGTFVLSYAGIHALALHAGIAPRLARGYPLLIDAMLVIVLAAVLALRGAELPSKLLAWSTLLAVLAAAAGADALHAVGRRLPRHVAAITAAVLPWVLLFLAFALLLAMLRHARLRRLAAARELPLEPGPDDPGSDEAAVQPGGQDDRSSRIDHVEQVEDVEEVDVTGARAELPEQPEQPEQPSADGEHDEQDDPDMPVFHRMWSSPTPPEQPA